MGKEYRYRAHIRWGQYVFPAFFAAMAALPGYRVVDYLVSYASINSHIADLSGEFLALYVLLVFTILMTLVVWYLCYRLAGVRVAIEDDAVVYRNRLIEKRIRFDDIRGIKFSGIPYVGGWASIVSGRDNIRLTVVLEDIGGFLQELKASLDQRGLSDRYDEARFFHLVKMTVNADQSWARAYEIFWKLAGLTLLSAAISVAIAVGTDAILWAALAPWPLIVYIWTEIVFMRRAAKASVRESFAFPQRDVAHERAVYRKALVLGTVFYLVTLLLIVSVSILLF